MPFVEKHLLTNYRTRGTVSAHRSSNLKPEKDSPTAKCSAKRSQRCPLATGKGEEAASIGDYNTKEN